MNLKIQCQCGSRYSFEVEPQDGRMPFTVACPACGVDGTESANALIAQSAAALPSLRVTTAPVGQIIPIPAPIRESPDTRRAVQNLLRQKKAAEKKKYRLSVWILAVVIATVLGYAGFWAWYYFSGSKPHVVYETAAGAGDSDAAALFIAADRFVLADDQRATLHDLKTGKDIWSTSISPVGTARKPQVFATADSIWLCLGNQVLQIDKASGAVKKTIPVDGEFDSFTPTDASLLVVSTVDATTRRALRINAVTGEVASQDVVVPLAEKHEMPNELPPNVQPTAGALEAQESDEHKFNQPLDAMRSQIFTSDENPVELRVRLEEPKVIWVDSVKPDPTKINGETTASTTVFGVSDAVFNQLERSRGAGARRIDQSRYEVKLRRWDGAKWVEWTGESVGPPAFFPLKTVDLVACGKTLIAVDKQNHFLFQANLSYPVAERYLTNHGAAIPPPAVEGPGGLYFADQGVLTAFSLPGGQVRWRLTTVGVTKLQFGAGGELYVNSSTASPQDIQYSDQITFDKAKAVLMKLDPQTGGILWQHEGVGYDTYLSGKFVYSTSADKAGMAIAAALSQGLGNVPESEEPLHFHLYRINPATGQTMWDVFHLGIPRELTFQDNKFVLCYDHDVQVWRAWSF